jgi:hypothetical protein
MTNSSSYAQSNMESTSNGKRILNDMHSKVIQLEDKKSQYEDFIKEREEFFRKKFLGLF